MVATSRMRHRRDFQAAHQGVKVAGKYVVLHHKTLINQYFFDLSLYSNKRGMVYL